MAPVPAGWFSSAVEYRGKGRAEFRDPAGFVEGPTTVRFDELGHERIEMEVERFESAEELRFGLEQLLSGSKPVKTADGWSLSYGTPHNTCTALTVHTDDGGVYRSLSDNILFALTSSLPGGSSPASIRFHCIKTAYTTAVDRPAAYWVLPLINFTADLYERHPALTRHPLRIQPVPPIPANLPSEKLWVSVAAWSRSPLGVFIYEDGLGFIERLPDYEERKQRLMSGQQPAAITAVLVGPVGAHSTEPSDITAWLPVDLLPLLGLATGTAVGSPWVELRDGDGYLTCRLHYRLGSANYAHGHPALSEPLTGTLGELITSAVRSRDWGKTHVRVVMKHLVRAGEYRLTIEDRLSHVFRAFDAMIQFYELGRRLSPMRAVDRQHKKKISKILNTAAAQVRELANELDHAGKHDQAATIRRVAGRLSAVQDIQAGYGQSLVALLDMFHLPDGAVMEQFYSENPRPDKRTWPEVISMYRGLVMHQGYLDFAAGAVSWDDAQTILNHCLDVLIRLVLIILGFIGKYQPAVVDFRHGREVGWVTRETPPWQLGYHAEGMPMVGATFFTITTPDTDDQADPGES